MTKDAYFEMCDMLGTEPVEEEIPIEFSDFPITVQQAFGIYSKLRDEWDGMNGTYLGKNYSGIMDILTLLEVPVEDRKSMFELIGIIDGHRSTMIAANKPKSK